MLGSGATPPLPRPTLNAWVLALQIICIICTSYASLRLGVAVGTNYLTESSTISAHRSWLVDVASWVEAKEANASAATTAPSLVNRSSAPAEKAPVASGTYLPPCETTEDVRFLIARNTSTGVEPSDAGDVLDECVASAPSNTTTPKEFELLLEDHIVQKKCGSPMTPKEFLCKAKCPLFEPELEHSVRLMRLAEHGAEEHIVNMCKTKVAPTLIWVGKKNRVRWIYCISDDKSGMIGPREFAGVQRLLYALSCIVELPEDFVFGFDPNDYATPTWHAPFHQFQYMTPLPALARFVGTSAHSGLLIPTGSHIIATAHCYFRARDKWWKVCTAHETKRDRLPFMERNQTVVMWRGLPTGVPWSETTWRHQQRARLVREFRFRPGFDVGFTRGLKRVSQRTEELKQQALSEWHQVKEIPKEQHPNYAYLLHLDGNTASWGLSHKLNSGSAVLWVESAHDYREHFYALLQPWVHYIPILPDLSDLGLAQEWTRKNAKEAERIARNAAKLADQRMRPQDLYCYMYRLLASISAAQTRGERMTESNAERLLGASLYPRLNKLVDDTREDGVLPEPT